MSHRKTGIDNRPGLTLAEAIILAATKVGSNGRGKGGLDGYFQGIIQRHPMIIFPLLLRILIHQLKNENPGPPQQVTFDFEKVLKLSKEEQESVEKLWSCVIPFTDPKST